jgi:hypothetical protein
MADTARLELPLLDAGQAQKHVTVNEALTRLDAFGAAGALSRSVAAPPPAPAEGDLYVAPAGAGGAWAGLDDRLVAFANGGWIAAAPEPGRRLWIADEGREVRFDGAGWAAGEGALGAATELRVLTLDHAVGDGLVSTTKPIIPDKAIVLGVTARVLTTLDGVDRWRLGVEGGPDRYGSGYGGAEGAWAHGVTGQPQAYYGATALRLEAEAGAFKGGVVRLAIHLLALTPPRTP